MERLLIIYELENQEGFTKMIFMLGFEMKGKI